MRCSEARRRLIKFHGTVSADDKELKQHLLTCSDCAAFARAEQALCRDLAVAAVDENTDDIPLSALKTRVEARAESIHQAKTKEIPLMSRLIKQVRKRPSLGLTFGIAVAVLAFITLIPFSFENTVGYEVAIAGVNKDLAMDSDRVNELLAALGMDGANVDVGDCEATCVLKISDLETEGDVKVIVAAFDELGNSHLQDISEVFGTKSMTIFQNARKNMFIKGGDGPDGEEVHEIIIKAFCDLDSATDGQFNIWVTDDADTVLCNNFVDGEGHNVIMVKQGCEPGGEHSGVMQVTNLKELKEGHAQIYITDENGEQRLLDLSDADAAEHLKKLGINIDQHFSSRTGGPDGVWISDDSCVHTLDEYLCNGDSNMVIIKKIGDCTGAEGSGSQQCIIDVKTTEDGDVIVVVDDDGNVHRINLTDPDAIAQLEALGFEVEVTLDDDGEIQTIRCMKDDGTTKVKMKYSQVGDVELKETPDAALPDGFELKQNYPNPFNPTTQISFTIPETQQVLLEVFNINGQRVRTLLDAVVSAGELSVEWDSNDDSGNQVASGMYFYRLTAGDLIATKKMSLVK